MPDMFEPHSTNDMDGCLWGLLICGAVGLIGWYIVWKLFNWLINASGTTIVLVIIMAILFMLIGIVLTVIHDTRPRRK